jgi:hypothetical protein
MTHRCFTCVLMVTSAFGIIQCHKSEQLSDVQSNTIRHEIQQMLDSCSQSVRSEGLTGFVRCLHNSPESRWTCGSLSQDYEAVVKGNRFRSQQYTAATIQWDSVIITPLYSDRASVVARFLETIRDTSGVDSSFAGRITCEMFRSSEGWKFHLAHTDTLFR